ncbi:MAG: tRNA dihydrouridine synthase DusB [Planctomycetes bacterium]|nr:tRNA dihydrouridine synthase DusB [Planctomycetota bacterium]
MLKIGSVTIPSKHILAPISGVSDTSFRLICRSFGCKFAFLGMVSARALAYNNRTTHKMLSSLPEDSPLGVQILGFEPEYIKIALEKILKYPFDIIDLNAACPARKAVRRGEGATLLNDPKKLKSILKIIVESTKKPVTVKIRTGFSDSINALDIARQAEDSGIKALFIHGRTREQQYAGRVDYDIIRKVKQTLKIPVIASGDVLSATLAKKMLDETGCDGLLIARGSFGNPWIFKEIDDYLRDGTVPQRPCLEEITTLMIKHFELCIKEHGEESSVYVFRKFFHWYTKAIRNVQPLRVRIFEAKTPKEVLDIIEELCSSGRKVFERPALCNT